MPSRATATVLATDFMAALLMAATAGVALGAAGLAGFLLLAGIGGPGAGVVGACGGALALLTFGSVPAEKQ